MFLKTAAKNLSDYISLFQINVFQNGLFEMLPPAALFGTLTAAKSDQ